jgi:16S rRNA U516 pseudouridylate synthase RsuA-like enzyme
VPDRLHCPNPGQLRAPWAARQKKPAQYSSDAMVSHSPEPDNRTLTPWGYPRYAMARLILFNKPYGVLSQFSDTQDRPTLKHYIEERGM